MIPEDHEKSYILASVPGTPAASEAVIMANIPETATVERSEATLEVSYEGEPEFSPVPGAEGVEFAVNTNFDVFKVNDYYYCCFQAVWFVSASPNGPWTVCDNVPEPIYTVPPEHPKHNVTYVAVKDSTPTTVQTSYTSGYQGNYVAVAEALDLTRDEVSTLGRNAYLASFLEPEEKARAARDLVTHI